ncbi:10683_t:CDS:1 [Funneliformis geosporum]|uniref:10683_t:CDS:1 n=1 Tax=Funneliformis geosporum TaxID=1117311 RepID=A0A9W4T1Z1_9GLOM|nr:10683_t:CDS:1 [Funneliformis geosporum]
MNMDKKQVLNIVRTYLYSEPFLPEAKKELKEIELIANFKEKHKRASIVYNYHKTYSELVKGYAKDYNLLAETNGVVEYGEIIDKLHDIIIKDGEENKKNN